MGMEPSIAFRPVLAQGSFYLGMEIVVGSGPVLKVIRAAGSRFWIGGVSTL